MARKLIEHISDDLDGTPITNSSDGRTVTFSIDRAAYEIDLTTGHADELEAALRPFINAARNVGRPQRTKQKKRSKKTLDEIRTWAQGNGHTVSDRGRIPLTIMEAYDSAH